MKVRRGGALVAIGAVMTSALAFASSGRAAASGSPYVVAEGVCVHGYSAQFGDQYLSDVEVTAYNMPATAFGDPDVGGFPDPTADSYFALGYPGQTGPTAGTYAFSQGPASSGFETGIAGGFADANDVATAEVYVFYKNTTAANGSFVQIGPMPVRMPSTSSCGHKATTYVSPAPGGVTAPVAAMAVTPSGNGYWLVGRDSRMYAYGDAGLLPFPGQGGVMFLPSAPIVGFARTADGRGYWMVGSDGGVFSFGTAQFYGSTGGVHLAKPIVGMAATPDGKGYWLVASDGGVFAFGDAKFYGSTGGVKLDKPVIGMATDAATGGYWLYASDGGIFAFHARFYGSTGSVALAKPIVAMEAAPNGSGYRFVASDGGVFCFNQPFEGSLGGTRLAEPIASMAASPAGGYWLVASDGGVFSFKAPYLGSAA